MRLTSPPRSGTIRMSPSRATPARKPPSGETSPAPGEVRGRRGNGDLRRFSGRERDHHHAERSGGVRDLAQDPRSVREPVHGLALDRLDAAHVSGAHRHQGRVAGRLRRDGQDLPAVGREPGTLVALADAEGERFVGRPEVDRIAVGEEGRPAVGREVGEETVVGRGQLALLSLSSPGRRGFRPADPSARAERARPGRCRRGASARGPGRLLCAFLASVTAQIAGLLSRTCFCGVNADLLAVGGPGEPQGAREPALGKDSPRAVGRPTTADTVTSSPPSLIAIQAPSRETRTLPTCRFVS